MKAKKGNFFGKYWIYFFVAAAWILCTVLIDRDRLSPVIRNQLIPICCWVTMAVSLNLVVGVSGELSLGHAGFMSLGAFSGLITAAWLQNAAQVDSPAVRQALAMIIGGVLLAVLPDWFLTQAIPWLLAAGALLQLGLSLAKLARTGWDLRRERRRVTLGMLALGIAVILLVKDHAPFLLLSAGLGGLFLLLAYHHAIHAREAGRRHPVRRGRSALFAVLYAAAGMFILVAPARLIASFSLASGLALLADGLVSLFTALCGRWQLRQRHRDAC